MAITLEQSKVGMADKVEQMIIDEFRRGSRLFDALTFDNAVSPGTGGSTLTYGYTILENPATAAFRKLNKEYNPGEATRKKATIELKIFGGAFEIDRIIQETAGMVDELEFQAKQKVLGAINLAHHTIINGDSTKNEDEFDGLKAILKGTDTEITSTSDLSGVLTTEKAETFIEEFDNFLSELDGDPSMIFANNKMLNKIKAIARKLGYFSRSEDAFGNTIEKYGNIELVDLKKFYNGTSKKSEDIIPINADGTTEIYAVCLGLDGFHGVSPKGDKVIKTRMPDLEQPGVMKKGDVECVMGTVLKSTRKAGVLKGIQLQAKPAGK